MLYKYAIVIKIGWENSILKNLYCNRRPDWNTRNGEDLKLQSTTGVLGHPCNLWFDLIWFIMLELKLNYLKPNQSRKPKGQVKFFLKFILNFCEPRWALQLLF